MNDGPWPVEPDPICPVCRQPALRSEERLVDCGPGLVTGVQPSTVEATASRWVRVLTCVHDGWLPQPGPLVPVQHVLALGPVCAVVAGAPAGLTVSTRVGRA